MTCKDCLHNGACSGFTPTDLDKDVFDYCREGRADEIPDIEDRCNEFENKTDFVEVVRCKYCKYFERLDTRMKVCKHERNTLVTESAPKRVHVLAVNENHYCGYGITVADDFISNFPSNERLGSMVEKMLSSERGSGNEK